MLNPLSSVEKKGSTKRRVITDMSASGLNATITPPRFVLPSVQDVAADAYEGARFCVTDLSDGFMVCRLHRDSTPLLGVRHPRTGKLYTYQVAPQGNAYSPFCFSKQVARMVQEVTSNFPEFRPHEFRENDTDPHMPLRR